MNFAFTYTSAVPSAARTVIEAAAADLASHFSDSNTVHINIDFSSIFSLADTKTNYYTGFTYDSITSALRGSASTAADSSAYASLPTTSPASSYGLAFAQATALGLKTGALTDASIAFSTGYTFDYDRTDGIAFDAYDFYATAFHELTHAMGRNLLQGISSMFSPSDLFKYSAAGVHVYSATTSGYFSVDGGVTPLMNYNVDPGGTVGDWAADTATVSGLQAFIDPGIQYPFTDADLLTLDVVGWHLIGSPAPAPAPGAAPVVDLNTATTGVNRSMTFTEMAGADTGANAVSFSSGGTNITDTDSTNLANLRISINTTQLGTGDRLKYGNTAIDITTTSATGEVSAANTVFKYQISDVSGIRSITFTSLTGTGGTASPGPIAAFEALLDGLYYNNTSDTPVNGSVRGFAVRANDGVSDSAAATFTVTLASTNDVPTLTTMSGTVVTVNEDTQAAITFANLQSRGNEADADGTVTAFVVKAVSSGTLLIGTSAGTAAAWVAGTNDVIDSTKSAFWTPAANANGTLNAFTVVAKDDSGAVSATPVQAQVSVASVNDAPTLTSMAGTVVTVNEDAQAAITFANIAAQANEADVDGTVQAFVVKAVSSGTLLIGTSAGTATAWAAGTNDVVDSTKSAFWTGAANANGTLNAFTVVAKDDGGLTSATPVQVQASVTAVNDAPTLTGMSGTVVTVNEDTQATVTFANIAAQANEADVDGTVQAFVVKAVSSGTLLIGTSAGTATVWAAGTNDVIDSTKSAFWTGAANANGILNAFTVVAKDDGGATSATPVQVQAGVTAVNDTPTGGVTISGTPTMGQALSAVTTTLADADGLGALQYQWKSNGTAITGATASSYTLTATEVGTTITVSVSYTDGGGTLESVTSAATAAVAAAPVPVLDLDTIAAGSSRSATFTEVAGADDASAAVTFTSGTTNLSDPDSTSFANVKVSISATSIASGDQLRFGATAIDITGTTATGEVTANGTVFSYAIADVSGTRTVTFTSLTGSGGSASLGAIASYEALLDGLKYNNTSDTPVNASTRSFSVTINDGTYTSAAASFTVTLAATNDPPTLTSMSGTVVTVNEDTQATITFANIAAKGNEADVDGTVQAFVVSAVSSGTLLIGTSAGTATAWAAGTNDVIDSTKSAFWTPATNANGTLNAFTVVAKDDGGLTSATPVQVQASVTSVNDAPTLTSMSGTVVTVNEDTQATITFANIAAKGNEADVDGTVQAFVVSAVSTGTLLIGTSAGTATAWAAGTNDVIDSTKSAFWTPAANANGTLNAFTVVAKDDGGLTSATPVQVQASVTSVNDAPTLTSMSGTVVTVNEDTQATITFANIAAKGNQADVDGTVQAFVVSAVSSGTLLIGTSAGTATAWAAGTNDVVDSTKSAFWTPAANANGTLNAFTVVAKDDGGLTSATPVQAQVSVTSVNDAPTLTSMSGTVVTVNEDTQATITFANIAAKGNEADVDGTVQAFVVSAVSSGTLLIGTSAGTATAWAAGTNDVIDSTRSAFWTPATNANGTLNAFTVVAKDDGGLTSATPVQVQASVTSVNDAPTLTSMSGTVVTVNEDTQATITFANIAAKGNQADVDGTVHAFVVSAVSSGTLLIGTSAGTATAWAAGTNDVVDSTKSAFWTPAANANGTLNAFTVVAKDDGGLTSATPVQVQASVTAVNDAPTLTSMSGTVVTVNEDTQATITFANIAAKGNEADVDGTVQAFVVSAVSTGTLLIGTSAGTATAWAAGTNDVIDSTRSAFWTPATNANGTLNAFTVVAKDDGGLTSATPVQVQASVTSVNDAPTLTSMSGTVVTVNEDTQATITFANIAAKGNQADVDGTVQAFVVSAVSSGTLLIGTSAGTATAWAAGTNDVIDSTKSAFWTPAANANGTLNAFTVVAKDDGGATSATPVQVQASVTPVNDAPTLTSMSGTVVSVNEDTQATITFADIAAKGNEADVDGTVQAFVVSAVSSGTLLIGTSAGTATAWAAGTNDVIDSTKSAFWTPAANANGTLNAFTVVAKDDGGLTSATPVQVQASVTAVNDAPTLTSMSGTVVTVNEDTQATITFANIAAKGNEADVDGTVQAFVVSAVSTGTLLIGTSAGTATAWAAGTNDVIDSTRSAFWTGAANANGTLNVFTVVAKDDGGATSATAVQVQASVTPVNDLPTGAVTVSGTPDVGQVLSAVTTTLADADGLGAFAYQWKADGSAIGGATASSYTLTASEVGKAISVTVSYTDGGGTAESVTSAATATVGAGSPPVIDLDTAAGGVNRSATFTEMSGTDTGANAVAFTSGSTNVSDADSTTLANLKISISSASIAAGDQLRFGSTIIDITGTAAAGEVTANGTVFGYSIADAAGTRTVTFTSLSGSGGSSAGAVVASYESLLDGLKYNNTSDSPVNGSTRAFSVTANDGLGTSAAAVFTVTLAATNEAPTLTTMAGPVATVNEDTQVAISFGDLAAQGNEADVDGTVQAFVVKAVSSGTLLIGTSAGTATAWASGTNDIVDATHNAYWTGSANANGTLSAFTVEAKDDAGATSASPVQVQVSVTPVNDAPTLTAMAGPVATVNEDSQAQILFSDIAAQGNEADVDGSVTAFVVPAVSSGALLIGASVGTATAWAAGTNDVIDATHNAYWTGAANANGTLDAFTVLAKDDGGATSASPVQVQVSVTAVNDAPTLTTMAGPVATTSEDTQAIIAIADIAVQGNASDVDGTVTGYVVAAVSGGTLLIGTSAGTATAWATGTNDVIDATHSGYWTAAANANGTLNAFTVLAQDDLGATSAAPVQAQVTVTPVNDAPTGSVTISGAANSGQVLTAVTATIADADGLGAFSYQWNADGTAITGATAGTYTLTGAEIGSAITVTVSYTDQGGTFESLTSAATAPVGGVLNLTLTGTAGSDVLTGDTGDDSLSGLGGNDTLLGGAGNDTLIGGAGTDSMDGQDGSDLYYILASEHSAAEIKDTGAGGTDEVRFGATSSATLTLFAGDTGIEKVVLGTGTGAVADTSGTASLTLNASAVTNALAITGNAGANTITATAFNDTIDGGAGTDKMTGGAGNDTYYVDVSSDAITEGTTGGTDLVYSASATYTLGNNVENLTLAGSGVTGIGNSMANTITGNALDNVINGKSGLDVLDGCDGSDIYMVDVAADHPGAEVMDTGATGIDELRFATTTASTLTLYAGDTGLERVVMGTGTAASAVITGTKALGVNAIAAPNGLTIVGNAGANTVVGTMFVDTFTGNAGNDTMSGNDGDDVLAGGNGNDSLTGGAGADDFVFDFTPNGSSNRDTITDFETGIDQLQFSKAVFTALGAIGTLTAQEFWSGAGVVSGHDADDRIVYNTSTGALYYDADGSGAGAAVQVALLGTAVHPAIVFTDIAVIA